jgi:hypothetical protein
MAGLIDLQTWRRKYSRQSLTTKSWNLRAETEMSASHCLRVHILAARGSQPLYVKTRPHKLFVPQMPERKHSSCTIWLWSTKRLTSGP